MQPLPVLEEAPEWALILAGGKSRRLGRDKAALDMGGQTLLARTVALARKICPKVGVLGRDPAPCGVLAPWWADATQGLGPIGGIMTALEQLGCPCLVLSCDLPYMDENTLHRLLAAWRARPRHALLTTFEQAETGFIEALVAVYEPAALPRLRASVAQGRFKLSGALPPEVRHTLVYTAQENRPFFNLNTPDELKLLRSDPLKTNTRNRPPKEDTP